MRAGVLHPDLTVTTGALVHRVVLENGRAVGIEYSRGFGELDRAFADHEVILCGGALGSPKTLLLSGIGPSRHLAELGIDTVVDLPGGAARTCTTICC